MVDLSLLEDMEEVVLLQEEVMEPKVGKDGLLTLLEDMKLDLVIAAEDIAVVVEVSEEVAEGTVEVAKDLEVVL